MANSSGNNERDMEWWRKVASRLALMLAITILASGVVGGWISFENRTLNAYKRNNELLRNANKSVVEKLASTTNELQECKKKNEELEDEIFNIKVSNASLKALLDE